MSAPPSLPSCPRRRRRAAPSPWARGFPDFDCDPRLLQAVSGAMQAGHNPYPPMAGVPAWRAAIARKIGMQYGRRCDPDTEITVTAGATQAIFTAISALMQPGDEVIVLEPCYDSYVPNIVLAGGRVVRVPLDPHTLRPDFDRIAAALTPRTRPRRCHPDAAHPRAHRQYPAQPQRHHLARRGLAAPCRRAVRHRGRRHQRRGVRAHGVRRPVAPQRAGPSGTGRPQCRRQHFW